MELAKTVDDYLLNNQQWKAELEYLRHLMLSTECVETLKWGMPTYTINKKNVVGIGAFKSYVGLWFFQGIFMSDHAKVLHNAQGGKTKALRQWRFNGINAIDAALVLDYVQEAIQNQKDGKELKVEAKKAVPAPAELKMAMAKDKQLEKAYLALSPGKRNEYAEYIGSAKQEKTRLSRLQKAMPLILAGKGMNDRYRK